MSEFLIILALFMANGVFAGAEIAVLSVRKTRLRELAEAGSSRAKALIWLRSHPERFLATVQVAITVISATAAAFGGSSVAANFADESGVTFEVMAATPRSVGQLRLTLPSNAPAGEEHRSSGD